MTSTLDSTDAPSVLIADAVFDDLAVVSHLIQTSGAYQGDYIAQVQDRYLDAAYLRNCIVRVARDGQGDIIGFHSIDTPGRGGPGEAELDWMIVRDDHQGKGLGRLLLTDAVQTARLADLSALVIVAHPPASVFYRRCGAVFTGVLAPQGKATWPRDIFRLQVV